MMVVPVNPNAVYVPMMPNGCCQTAFDTTYPAQLHGIIQPGEYQQSITNINQSLNARKNLWIILAISILIMLAGIGLLGGGVASTSKSKSGTLFIFIGVGAGLLFVGMMLMSIGSCILQVQQTKKLRAAVAVESAKYSSRSQTPCSWRLDMTTTVGGYGRNRRAVVVYHLMIDIGRQTGAYGAQATYQNNSYSQPYGAPPPYSPSAPAAFSGQPPMGFCARCKVPRQNPSMKFCGSCGQAYS